MPFSGDHGAGECEPRPATVADVSEHIRVSCALASARPTVGAEVEWLVVDLADPAARPTEAALRRSLAGVDLPGGSRLSFEPGGQVELSSRPAPTADEVQAGLLADFSVLRLALRSRGFDLVATAHDASRAPQLVSDNPRYAAMEQWFSSEGWTAAPEMMCNTTSIQVNVGCGPDPSSTWRRANQLAPVLAAMFAWSSDGRWASSRLRTWAALDPSRTASALVSGDAIADWTQFALDASVMLRRLPEGSFAPMFGGVSLREWVENPPAGWPPATLADVDLHLTTLFPPVRLKGWIEVRVIDMPADGSWSVPLAVTYALLAAPPSGPAGGALAFVDDVRDVTWREAAQTGLDSPRLAAAADHALRLALSCLDAQGSNLVAEVRRFHRERVMPRLTTRPSADAR